MRRRRLDGQPRRGPRGASATGVALQGNLDPNVLFAGPEAIRSEVATLLDSFRPRRHGGANGHVFNLGHGISQHTPPEHVAVLVEAVHRLSRPYHAAPET